MTNATNEAARIVAMYLPQFYPTPENDNWWGEGFTEWTNVKRALPLFPGHNQPRMPGELGYYDLRDADVRCRQAELARDHGLAGFCYYHYWFAGRRLLDKPFGEVLASGEPDFPFCLCWANESWTGVWHGAPDRILIEQTYPGRDDHARHFEALLPAFTDHRYLKVQEKPLFVIFQPLNIPHVPRVLDLWRDLAQRNGLPGIYLVGIRHWMSDWVPSALGFDASTTFRIPPAASHGIIPRRIPTENGRIVCYEHEEIIDHLVVQESKWRDYPSIGPNWDNSPRCGVRGIVLRGSSPRLFRQNVHAALDLVRDWEADQRLIFVKAWNEWAEGNYLEPDSEFGRGYLEAIRDELA